MNIEKLIKMGNQIGAYFESDPDHAQEEIAAHLKRFWAPQMRRAFVTYVLENDPTDVKEVVVRAVRTHRHILQ